MSVTLADLSRQLEEIQLQMARMMAAETAAAAPPVQAEREIPDCDELSDEDLFYILERRGMDAYKQALRRRNRVRKIRLRKYGRL